MKSVAVICEYNPLHSGHVHLIKMARRITGADRVFCIMSGSFVQRGEPAVCDRFTRALWAIEAGADLVAELPALSGSLPAESFALAGVRSAIRLGADYLAFGSERGKIEPFITTARYMESAEFKKSFSSNVAKGYSYPRAVASSLPCAEDVLDLSLPNNVLGLTYVRALRQEGASIEPITLLREGDYHSSHVHSAFMSATAVREALSSNDLGVVDFVSSSVYDDCDGYDGTRIDAFNDFCFARAVGAEKTEIAQLYEISEGLENRIKSAVLDSKNFNELLTLAKTKRYTRSRLKRILTYLALGITKDFVQESLSAPYLRVLAVKHSGELLTHLGNREGVYLKYSEVPDNLKHLWEKENSASNLRAVFSPTPVKEHNRDNAIILQ